MKRKRYSEEQIIRILKQGESGIPVRELCREHGMSQGSYYAWRSKFGGMEVSDAKRLRALGDDGVAPFRCSAQGCMAMGRKSCQREGLSLFWSG